MRAALILAAAAACGGASPSPGPAGPATGAPAALDPTHAADRLDAIVTRALVELDRDGAAIVRGPALDPTVRIKLPARTGDAAPTAPVEVDYFYELACKYCAKARAVIADLERRFAGQLVVVRRVVIVHRVPAMTAHLVACAAETFCLLPR